MNSVIFKLLPYSESGIVSRHSDDTLIISGFRNDIDLEALQAELEVEWLELARQEAANRIKNALIAAQESRRPANFSDLTIKLQLGRITPAEREQLNAYYDALDALDEERAALEVTIAEAATVAELNAIAWPEWVGWEPLPLRFDLLAEPPKPAEPDPIKPEPARPDLPEPDPIKPDPIEPEDKT